MELKIDTLANLFTISEVPLHGSGWILEDGRFLYPTIFDRAYHDYYVDILDSALSDEVIDDDAYDELLNQVIHNENLVKFDTRNATCYIKVGNVNPIQWESIEDLLWYLYGSDVEKFEFQWNNVNRKPFIFDKDTNPSDFLEEMKHLVVLKSLYQESDETHTEKKVLEEGDLSDYTSYDYKTKEVLGKDCIDTTKTGMSYYDDFLKSDQLKYLQTNKNRDGKIVMMSPQEYYEECAKNVFNVPIESLKKQRGEYDRGMIEKLKEVILSKKKAFPLPFIDYADKGQEGLHRMFTLGELFGWDEKFPVLVVTPFDDELEKKYKHQREIRDIDKWTSSAISKAKQDSYILMDIDEGYYKSVIEMLTQNIKERLADSDLSLVPIVTEVDKDTYQVQFEGYEDEEDLTYIIDKHDLDYWKDYQTQTDIDEIHKNGWYEDRPNNFDKPQTNYDTDDDFDDKIDAMLNDKDLMDMDFDEFMKLFG